MNTYFLLKKKRDPETNLYVFCCEKQNPHDPQGPVDQMLWHIYSSACFSLLSIRLSEPSLGLSLLGNSQESNPTQHPSAACLGPQHSLLAASTWC